MEAKKPLNYPSDAQSLHALVNELKLMLSSPVLDNGAVLVGLLPKQRCCCDGSCCRGVEHKQTREDEETRDNKEIQERKEAGESKHSLEGVWEGEGSGAVIFIHAVQGKPGYLFGTKLLSTGNHAQFWVRISDGTLVGKALRLPSGIIHPSTPWVPT